MSMIFRLAFGLGIPAGLFYLFGGNADWLKENPQAPIVFGVFWLYMLFGTVLVRQRILDSETYGNLLSALIPTVASLGVLYGLVGCIIAVLGHPTVEFVNGPLYTGGAILLGVGCLGVPALLGGYSKPLANAGARPDTLDNGMMTSHSAPVTSMPLEGSGDESEKP